MPVYTIETPSGRRLKIEADTPEIAMQGAQEWSAANEGDKQPEKRTVGALEASNRGVEQGLTFGFGDELMAGAMAPVEAVVGGLQGKGFGLGDAYNRNLERERAMLQQARKDSPIASAVGEIGGGLMTGGGLAKSGATLIGRTAGKPLLTRALAGAGEGATYGAAYGFGSGEGGAGERLKGAGQGAAVGATIGGAIPVVGAGATKALRPIARKVGNRFNPRGAEQQGGIDRVLREAKGAGLTADDLMQGVRDGRTVGQMDPNLSDLTRAVKRQPGDQRRLITEALDSGYSANNQAAKSAAVDGMGAEKNFYMWRDAFAKSKSKGANKAYEAVFQRNWGKNGPPFELDRIVKSGRVPAEAVRSAERIARAEGRPFGKQLVASVDDASGAVEFSRLPSLEEAELIRRGLSSATSKAFRSGDGSVGAAYRNLEREMRDVLDNASPMLKQVRKAYATASQIQEAADEGLKLLNKSADEVEFIVSNASKPEREAMRKGLASALKNSVERGQMNRDAVRNLFGSERNRRVLETMWPDQKGFETFRKQMENAAEFSAFRQNVQGNSRTQQDLADAGAMAGGLGGAARNLMTGNFRGAAVDALMTVIGRTVNPAKGMPPETLKRMAQILVEKNPAEVQKLLTQVDRNGKVSGDLLVKLLERAQASPELQRNLTVGLVAPQ